MSVSYFLKILMLTNNYGCILHSFSSNKGWRRVFGRSIKFLIVTQVEEIVSINKTIINIISIFLILIVYSMRSMYPHHNQILFPSIYPILYVLLNLS